MEAGRLSAPSVSEVQAARRGLVESSARGGLRLALEGYLELPGDIAKEAGILRLLAVLVRVSIFARHGPEHERAAIERIIPSHWRV